MTRKAHTDRNGDDVRTWSGFCYSTVARSTGTLVVVVDNRDDAWETDNTDKWLTICDTHATVCSHRTHRLARDHAANPELWCEPCQAETRTTVVVPTEVFTQPAPERDPAPTCRFCGHVMDNPRVAHSGDGCFVVSIER